MKFKEIKESAEYKKILEGIPEEERAKVEEAIEKLSEEFSKWVLEPIEKNNKL